MGKVILFFGYQVGVVMLQTSALYIVTYLLDAPASTISVLLGSMLGGALISVPVWMVISRKTNNNRLVSLAGGFLLSPQLHPNDLCQWFNWLGDLPGLFWHGAGQPVVHGSAHPGGYPG